MALGDLLGICVLVPLGNLLWGQIDNICINLTTVELLHWSKHTSWSRPYPPERGEHGWDSYAGHDLGSSVANCNAFWRRRRGVSNVTP